MCTCVHGCYLVYKDTHFLFSMFFFPHKSSEWPLFFMVEGINHIDRENTCPMYESYMPHVRFV